MFQTNQICQPTLMWWRIWHSGDLPWILVDSDRSPLLDLTAFFQTRWIGGFTAPIIRPQNIRLQTSWCVNSQEKVFPLNFVSMAPERSREWDFNLAIHLGPCDNVFRFRMYGKSPTHLGLEYIMTEGRVIRVATPRCAPVADQSTGDWNWKPRDFNWDSGLDDKV